MKILVTGAKGFIGKNLIAALKNRRQDEILAFDTDTDPSLLDGWCADCAFVFHLAGVNRPKEPEEFMRGNAGFTAALLDSLRLQLEVLEEQFPQFIQIHILEV